MDIELSNTRIYGCLSRVRNRKVSKNTHPLYTESKQGGVEMKEQKYHIYLTNQERSEIIESLIDFKNLRMQQGKYTDAVDEVLVKVIRAKKKKLKIVYI